MVEGRKNGRKLREMILFFLYTWQNIFLPPISQIENKLEKPFFHLLLSSDQTQSHINEL